jgi:hypothetical protein
VVRRVVGGAQEKGGGGQMPLATANAPRAGDTREAHYRQAPVAASRAIDPRAPGVM